MSTPHPLHVRRIRESDWKAARELRLRALATDPLAFGSTLAETERRPPEFWQDRVRKGATSAENVAWVAVDESEALHGTVTVARVEGVYHLFGMWLAPEDRGKGAGGNLLDFAVNWVHANASGQPLLLGVNPRQKVAAALYASRGFRPTGTTRPLEHTPGEVVIEMILHPEYFSRAVGHRLQPSQE